MAWSEDLGLYPVAREVARVCRAACATLAELGAAVEAAEPDLGGAMDVFKTHRAAALHPRARDLEAAHPGWREAVKATAVWNLEQALALDGQTLLTAERERTRLYRNAVAFFERYDFLVLPTTQVAPFPVEQEWVREIEGVSLPTYLDWMASCCVISVTGLPSISVPCGFTAAGAARGAADRGPAAGGARAAALRARLRAGAAGGDRGAAAAGADATSGGGRLMSPRQRLRASLRSGAATVFAPLCLDALTARLAERCGFEAGYVSGGALGYAHAVSEALLTLSELADATRHVTARSALPIVVDGGVGFGDAVHVARTVWELEASGAAAVEIEDQVAPKRVSHHRGIEHLVSTTEMVQKIEAALAARTDPDFLVIARTGAVRNEGFEAAVERARGYRSAGADLVMLMPADDAQRARLPERVDAPLATIAPFDAVPAERWREAGWRLVIDPITAQVLAVDAIRRAYERFAEAGTTGRAAADVLARYRELPALAGLEALYEIEDRTTERGGG